MNLEKILYGVLGVSIFVLILTIIEHISIRIYNDPTILGTYVAITLGVAALAALLGDFIADWIKGFKKDDE